MKRGLTVFLAFLLIFSLLAGCNAANKEPGQPEKEAPTPTEDGGVTIADPSYFPIVASPVTLSVAIQEEVAGLDITKNSLWAELCEKTGISFDLRLISSDSDESVKLMFIGRDYPDFCFRLKQVNALANAAMDSGDILELTDDMINRFAPNWAELFKSSPDVYTYSLHTNGKLYSLPNYMMSGEYIYLRDTWLINSNWLDELGMQPPETIDDFTGYLRAVKRAAGTGTIPSNVVPLYIRDVAQTENIGSWHTIADTFGLYNGLFDEIVEDGVVKSNAQNPLLKTVFKYLNQLYSEELINADFGSSSWSAYQAAIDTTGTSTEPWYIGSYFGWYGWEHDFLDYLAPVKTSSGYDPVVRPTGVSARFLKYSFMMFASNKYPVATLRLVDYFGTTEGAIRAKFGKQDVLWKYDDSGDFYLIPAGEVDASLKGSDYFPGVVNEDDMFKLKRDDFEDTHSRIYAYYNIYRDYIPDPDKLYIFPVEALEFLSAEEQARVTTLTTMYNTKRFAQTKRWIKGNGDIDAEWDDFQQSLADLGLNELLALQQKAYNLFMAARS